MYIPDELKLIDHVPKNTSYCYELVGFSDDLMTIKTNTCPFWSSIGPMNGHCSLLGVSDQDLEERGQIGLLWDQVKECGISLFDIEQSEQ